MIRIAIAERELFRYSSPSPRAARHPAPVTARRKMLTRPRENY